MRTLCLYLLTTLAVFADLPAEWKNAQPFAVAQPGLIKLSLPAETLSAARPGLEDLRIFDAAGREVPFLLSRPTRRMGTVMMPKKFNASLVDQTTVLLIETGGQQPLEAVTLETPASGFIKAVKLDGSNDGKTWTLLTSGRPVFRQPNGVAQLRVNFPEGNWPFLRVTVDDKRTEAVPFTGARLHGITGEQVVGEPFRAELLDRTENDGQTRLTLDLGAANLTLSSLRIETDEPLFMRSVAIAVRQVSENAVTEHVLARGTVYRVAVAGQPPSAGLEILLDAPVPTRELLVLIDNQDSPPLPVASVAVERWPVQVVFRAAQPGTFHILTGNPRCTVPHYDLAVLRGSLAIAPMPGTTQAPGPISANPSYQPAEPLPDIEKVGAPLDVTEWGCRKRVEIARAGVQQVELDLDVLAQADPAFRDLRLVRDGQQRPYILERTSIQRKLVPEISQANDPKRPTVSRWQLKLPKARLPVVRLTCVSSTALFHRQVRLYEQPADERGEKFDRPLGATSWVRTPPARDGTLTLTFDTPPVTDTIFMETDNGDNPAIELQNFAAFYPVTRVLFKAPTEPVTWLYYANRQAGFPQYDLDLIAPRLLAEEKATATLAAAEQLKKPVMGEFFQLTCTRSVIFWVALGLVVVILLVVIARLLPKETQS